MLYSVRNLARHFRRADSAIAALAALDLEIGTGELTVVVGPSGCGKTTLLQILGLIDTGFSGELRFQDRLVARLSSGERAGLRLGQIGFVFQNFQLVDALTVLENVALPHWRLHGSRRAAEAKARALLHELAIDHRLTQHPQQLSVGEMQRAAVARALICDPAVIIADEPTASLDADNAGHVTDTLLRLATDQRAVVVASHSPALIARASRVLTLAHGRLVSDTRSRCTVRPAQPSDVPRLSSLVNSAYRGESSKQGWTTEADFLGGQRIDEERLREILADPKQQILCLLDAAARIVATVCLERCDDEVKGPTYHLGMLTVEPAAQAGGLGKFLIAEAEKYVRARGAISLTLSVIQVRQELMAWYERRGFKKTGATEAFPYGNVRFGEPKRDDLYFVVFEKKLA